VNRKAKQQKEGARGGIGGRHRPPADHLVGRTEACNILGIDKREFRRLEDRGEIKPAVFQPKGVRWFDRDALWRFAAERHRAGKRQRKRASASRIQRVSGAETRRITEWFIARLSLGEIVLRSGKTYETIQYLHALYRRGLSGAPESGEPLDEPGYYPELEPQASRAAGAPGQPKGLAKAPRTGTKVPPHWFDGAPSEARAPQQPVAAAATPRAKTQVPDEWFTGELPPLDDSD
jgi:hypothetical protein